MFTLYIWLKPEIIYGQSVRDADHASPYLICIWSSTQLNAGGIL